MIGKCEARVPGKRPGTTRLCNATPVRLFTIYRDNEPYTQTYRCERHEPLFAPSSHYTVKA